MLEKRVESLEADVNALRTGLDSFRDTVLVKLVEAVSLIARR